MQIQLSTHSFRIFYGEDFGDHLAAVINALSEYSITFLCEWFEEYCIISVKQAVTRQAWRDILEEFFCNLIDDDEEEDEESESEISPE